MHVGGNSIGGLAVLVGCVERVGSRLRWGNVHAGSAYSTTSGETIKYSALLAVQFRVTLLPADTGDALAVKLEIAGADPLGTFAEV